MADHGHYGGLKGKSRQGTYICTANGKFLGSGNSQDADKVLEMMKRALKEWQQIPASERQLSDDSEITPRHRWEDSYPEDGLVLSMFTRDLPASGNANEPPASNWNQDRVWFSAAEAEAWLPLKLAVGKTFELPPPLLHRLVNRHLVDTVNGQTMPFRSNEILSETKIYVTVTELNTSSVEIFIHGKTFAQSKRIDKGTSVHGVETDILGKAIFDRQQSKFTNFEMVAIGKRWGKTTFNVRSKSHVPTAVGFVFRLSDPNEPRIPPAFVFSYEADWIARP